jgi:predicted ATPase
MTPPKIRPDIRVAFAGPSGAGKTTLMQSVSAKSFIDKRIQEVLRDIALQIGFYDISNLADGQRGFLQGIAFCAQVNREAWFSRMDRGFLSDRSALDYMAYSVALLPELRPAINLMLEQISRPTNKYDIIFIVPPFQDIPHDDGFRPAAKDARWQEVDRFVLAFIREHAAKVASRVHEVKAVGQEDRVAECMAVMGEVL